MALPERVLGALAAPAFARQRLDGAAQVLDRLGVQPHGAFREFFERYEGPFGSGRTGFELLDICAGTPSIVSATDACRTHHRFPSNYLALTELLGGSILMYRVDTDEVFDVDFEGGDQLLMRGDLTPRWRSFAAFLEFFFEE